MAEDPWLTIIGLGEDGPEGLPPASRKALEAAEVVIGPPRHLSLLPDFEGETREWPVPFADGLQELLGLRGRRVVVLASGDPFWFGAGSVIAQNLSAHEWRALPGPSTFSLAASRLGWRLERTGCFGLHAAPFGRLVPELSPGVRLILLLRDGAAAADLAVWLSEQGFGASRMHVFEALGGPRERCRETTAAGFDLSGVRHPVCAGLEIAGEGESLPLTAGRADEFFDNDGQITRAPVRAITLASLGPLRGQLLWDIGGGSGAIAIEWLLADASMRAISIEAREDRAARIVANAARLGADRLEVVNGAAPDGLYDLAAPDAVFVGGGLSEALLAWLWDRIAPGTRVVTNAVTLDSQALLADWQKREGGGLLRIDLSEPAPIGPARGWRAAWPIVQWSVRR